MAIGSVATGNTAKAANPKTSGYSNRCVSAGKSANPASDRQKPINAVVNKELVRKCCCCLARINANTVTLTIKIALVQMNTV